MSAAVDLAGAREVSAAMRVGSMLSVGVSAESSSKVADLIDALASEVEWYRSLTTKAAAMAKVVAGTDEATA